MDVFHRNVVSVTIPNSLWIHTKNNRVCLDIISIFQYHSHCNSQCIIFQLTNANSLLYTISIIIPIPYIFDKFSPLSLQTYQTYQTNVDPTLTTWQTVPGHGLAYKAVTLPKLLKRLMKLKQWRSIPDHWRKQTNFTVPKWTVKSSWSSSYIITSSLCGWATVENSKKGRRVFSFQFVCVAKNQKTIEINISPTWIALGLSAFKGEENSPPKKIGLSA